jgi:transcriptional regulator with XRE-family HTH domain
VITPAQCRAARGLIDWSQSHLAQVAGLGARIVREFEAGRSAPFLKKLLALQRAFEAVGVEFTDGKAPGVRLRKDRVS